MNARIKLVTLALGAVAASVALLTLTERSAKTQTTNPFPPVELVSQKPDGGPPNGNSSGAVASADGRCVAFYSDATNLVPQDNNGFPDVFFFDRASRVTTLVSVGANGQPANGPSQAQKFRPAIDGNCATVAFSSDATNLVAGDTNRRTDIFARDLGASTTRLVSVGLGGVPADGASSFASMSGDSGLIAFQSVASNLVANDTNRASDIFVADAAGAIARVSVGAGGAQADGPSITPSISADGRCVAFASSATNLLPGDTNGALDIYVACDGVVTCRASVSSTGAEPDQMSFLPALNANGTIVAFKSNATNLVPGDLNQAADVFVHNCASGETQRVSVGDEGQEGNDIAIPPSISGDGRFVAFGSFASNLLQGQSTGGFSQVYVRDLQRQTTVLVSSSLDGQPGNGSVPDIPPSITLDGQLVAFESLATDLIARNTQGYLDAYIRANVTMAPTATKTNTPPPTPTPTKPVPCTRDTDCPVGQVCGPEGVCVTAPTPTPTIACDNNDDCPPGLFCVDNVCRDLSTPTVTPTPLPTCVTDEDCPPGTECKAFVCVPPRECPDGQIECRGIREACLDGFCECGGDCNTDGIVFGSEITKMVCIVGGQCNIGICPAGDIDQNGSVTAADITLAVDNLGLGCPGEGSPLIYALDRTTETRTIEVGNITGIPGEYVNFEIALSGGDDVTTAQVDILYDQSQLQVTETPPCTLDPRLLDAGSFEAEVQLPQVPVNPPGMGRIRVAVLDKLPPIQSFGPGPVWQCKLRIAPGAAPGSGELMYDTQRLEIADPGANPFDAQVSGGAVVVEPRPRCVDDEMCPDGTECKGNECRPIIECDGPMAGPGQCLDDRQACVNDQCECVGDCNLDGFVRANEITIMINIINGEAPLESCPAGDWQGNDNGRVNANDITIAINNINLGCP